MPKKLKLNLNDLKVQSFVTALNEDERKKIKGGTDGDDTITGLYTCWLPGCNTNEPLPSYCRTGCTGEPCTGGIQCPNC